MNHNLVITDNAYVLCEAHVAEWRAGGNLVGFRPYEDGEALPVCSDCLYDYGYGAGRDRATWFELDSAETASRILVMTEDDPGSFWDSAPSPLSGEWADDPLTQDIMDILGVTDKEYYDEVVSDWLTAWSEGYEAEIVRMCREMLIAHNEGEPPF